MIIPLGISSTECLASTNVVISIEVLLVDSPPTLAQFDGRNFNNLIRLKLFYKILHFAILYNILYFHFIITFVTMSVRLFTIAKYVFISAEMFSFKNPYKIGLVIEDDIPIK